MSENSTNTNILKANKYIIAGAATSKVRDLTYLAGINASQLAAGAQSPDKELYKSKLNTSVVSDLTVPAFQYTDPITGTVYDVPELKIYDVLIKTTALKVIIKTYITGLSGSVKEYITSGDNDVVLEGRITGQNGVYPYDEVNALNKLSDAPVAFKVVSSFLQNLDIDSLVCNSIEMNQDEGGYSYQKFTMYCSTDIPVELNIISSSNTNV